MSCECTNDVRHKVLSTVSTISNLISSSENSRSASLKIFEQSVNSGVWMASSWGEKCETSNENDCTAGIQFRTVVCDRNPPHTEVCDSSFIPSTFKFCNQSSDCSKGEWYSSKWSDCGGDCFNLHKKRLVMCIQNSIVVSDDKCANQEKPADIVKCNITDVSYCGPRWHYSEWTEVRFIVITTINI